MAIPKGLEKPHRVAALVPMVLAALVVLAAAIFALSHLAAKGPAPQLGLTPQQAATNSGPPDRGPYNSADFTEPNAR